jgi:hypothetical protein
VAALAENVCQKSDWPPTPRPPPERRNHDLERLQIKCQFFKNVEFDGKRKRPHISSMICEVHEAETSELSKNGIAALASGIHVEGKQRRKRLVDFYESKAHQAVVETTEGARL